MHAGTNFKAAIFDNVRQYVDRHPSPHQIRHAAPRRQASQRPVANVVGLVVRQAVVRTANAIRPNLLSLLRRTITEPSGVGRAIRASHLFGDRAVSQHDLGSIGAYAFLRDIFGLRGETAQLFGLERLALAGWIRPCERVCWLSERHDRLRYNEQGRLHCKDGPRAQLPGWLVDYAWKGIIAPQAMIDDSITVGTIDREANIHIRRCMIEILTPERYIAEGGAIAVGTDECGTLWQKRWFNGDAWSAVQVVNGTRRSDGSAKHYFLQVPITCRTPREAVAWTYGMNEFQYSRLVVRT